MSWEHPNYKFQCVTFPTSEDAKRDVRNLLISKNAFAILLKYIIYKLSTDDRVSPLSLVTSCV
jgi:hypothetical protein